MQDKKKKIKILRIKITLVGFLFFFFFCAMVLRAYQLQILDNSKLRRLAQSQYKTKLIVNPKRGTIYDRNGDVLAQDILVASIGIHPRQITEKDKLKNLLLKHTSVSEKILNIKFSSNKSFEWIQRRIPYEAGKEIEKARIKGIQILKEYRRFYPNKELAGQFLGAVGYDAQALGGAELQYDKYLKSQITKKNMERDARGRFFSSDDVKVSNHDIFVTLDKNVQYITEDVLKEFAIKHKVKSGFAIVMDVEAGEVLAMANYPSFNPNLYWKYPQKLWKNHAVSDVFEPGSTFKTILMAAALASGKVKANDRFYCERGRYRIHRNVIRDHSPYGWLSAKDILKVSSNIGITKIANKIGRKEVYNFLKALGFGNQQVFGMVGESYGQISYYKKWKDIDFSNIAFGQGLSVTGMQMVMAYATIANGGYLIKPDMAKKIVKVGNTKEIKRKPLQKKKMLNEQTVKDLSAMLHSVTREGGTARTAHIDGYLSAGKTGTAQKYDRKLKAYAKKDFVSSFIGFSPVQRPKLLVYVVYDTPRQNGYYGGLVAGPAFKKITERTLKYYGYAPPNNDDLDEPKLSRLEMQLISENKLKNIQQSLGQNTVPDLRGLSLRHAVQVLKTRDVQFQIEGTGIVVKQYPKPGTKLKAVKKWKLELASRS